MKEYKRYKIINIVLIYLSAVFIFYFLGPIKWKTPNSLKLILFVVSCFLMLFLGFAIYYKKSSASISFDYNEAKMIKATKLMLFLNLIIITLYLFRNLGSKVLSFQNVIDWILNPSSQYMNKFSTQSYTVFDRIVGPLTTFSSFFLWSAIPLGIFYLKKLTFFSRFLLAANIIVELIRWFSLGTNKGVIDIILLFLCLYLYRSLAKGRGKNNNKFFRVFIIFIIALGLLYFTKNIGGRISENYEFLTNNLNGNIIDQNNFLLKIFPGLSSTIIYANSYLTQGYYGLSLCLEVHDFTPTFGIGHSVFLCENISDVLGSNLFEYTYINKANAFGWKSSSNWHTAFAWFANDLSFFGVPILMMLIGFYFAFICNNLFEKKKYNFFPLFCMMIQMFFYFSMNNQIFASPFSFMGFVGLNFYLFIFKSNLFKEKVS